MEIIFSLFSILFTLIWLMMFLLIIGGLIIWIIMLVDCVQRDESRFPNPAENTKVIWILVLIFGGLIGAIIYYFVVKRKIP